jgi:hypothetical protein
MQYGLALGAVRFVAVGSLLATSFPAPPNICVVFSAAGQTFPKISPEGDAWRDFARNNGMHASHE